MSDFRVFKAAVAAQFALLTQNESPLFVVDLTKEQLWDTYLGSFPEGSNPIYRKRTVHDCSCCRHFIRDLGPVVGIVDNQLVSIWDIDVPEPFKTVAAAMKRLVQTSPVIDRFFSKFPSIGTDSNKGMNEDGTVETYDHFFAKLPKYLQVTGRDSVDTVKAGHRDSMAVFRRSLDTLTEDAAETVLDLIQQGSLYRGEEHKNAVATFLAAKRVYKDVPDGLKDNWCWLTSGSSAVRRIRNTAIGTLLIDLSEGTELDDAVSKFEAMVAPANYKRPKALVTPKMIKEAEKQLQELGYMSALGRRYAVLDDISVNNVLFVNRTGRKTPATVFEEMAKDVPANAKNFSKLQEIPISKFLSDVLPNASSVQLLLEHSHRNNLMSLVAPKDPAAPSMFKWGNNFSWAYNNDVTDSMKEQVKAAGGKVDGVLRFSIRWNDGKDHDQSDLDAHCIEPGKNRIYFAQRENNVTKGNLDIDIRMPTKGKAAVENITWPVLSKMREGKYLFQIHGFAVRGSRGFQAEIEFDGQLYQFETNVPVRQGQYIDIAEVTLTNGKFTIKTMMDSTSSQKDIWGVKTNSLVNVSAIMRSPNHWEGEKKQGNEHFFFFLEGCVNPEAPRGFYNEFLQEDLMKHKRVFEVLGSKMRVEHSNDQLSGVGFSTTQRNSVVAKVGGSFDRMVRVTF